MPEKGKTAAPLALALLLGWAVSIQAGDYHAAAQGRGGAADFVDRQPLVVRDHPALIGTASGDWEVASGFGLYVNDSEDLIDAAERADREGMQLEAMGRQMPLLPGDEEGLVAALENLDGRRFSALGGTAVFVALPVSWGDYDLVLGSSTRFRTAARFNYREEDAETLRFATLLGVLNLAELQSRINLNGVVYTETGATFAGPLPGAESLRMALSIKHQAVRLIHRELRIDQFDEEDLVDTGRDIRRSAHLNLDLGLYRQWGPWHAALSISDVFRKSVNGPLGERHYVRPQGRLALGYVGERLRYALDLDLTPEEGFGVLEDRQVLRLGVEWPLHRRIALRAGYQYVLRGLDNHSYSAGIELFRGRTVSFDLAAQVAGSRELGAAGQLRVRF